MNPKGLLIELCQKNKKLTLPIFTTEKVGGDAHNPHFRCKCTFSGEIYIGEGPNKKEAEKIAAKKALDDFNPYDAGLIAGEDFHEIKNWENVKWENYKNVILVDGENVSIKSIHEDPNNLLLFFIAKNSTRDLVYDLQSKYDNCYVVISDSVGKDAADHLLTFTLGRIVEINKSLNLKYYVLTRDHYGEFLEKFTKNCKFICSELNLTS